MRNMMVLLVVLLVVLVGGILLQIFLSRRERRWPGLVLPGITFLHSLIMVLNAAAFVSMARAILAATMVFLISNIPTAVLLAIYVACRERRRKRGEMDRMRIGDL